jgi:hypothetical protein
MYLAAQCVYTHSSLVGLWIFTEAIMSCTSCAGHHQLTVESVKNGNSDQKL